MSLSTPSISEETVFIQHQLVGLQSGEYLISVQNKLTPSTGATQEETTEVNYKFAVRGSRYSMDPSWVHHKFPPSNSTGSYDSYIPHVVLTNKSLPWQRKVDVSGSNEGIDVPSWLAVLLVNEDDFNYEGSPVASLKDALKTGTVNDLLADDGDTFVSPLSLQGVTSSSNLDVGESAADPCTYIELPIEVFSYIAPSYDDLKMMANVRQVDLSSSSTNLSAKAILAEMRQQGETTDTGALGSFSIVLGNRLPADKKKHLAVLVSLEKMQNTSNTRFNLPTTTSGQSSATAPTFDDDVTTIRLPVLTSWKFTSDTGPDFTEILGSLNQPSEPTRTPSSTLVNPQLQFYPSDTGSLSSTTNGALNKGYIPVNHLTREGGKTASWYRGPLTPVDVSDVRVKTVTSDNSMAIDHPDKLLRFNPDTGIFDVSYAMAWQLGQLLALQDKTFSTLLYQWKQDALIDLVQQIDKYILKNNLVSAIQTLEQTDNASMPDADTNFYSGIFNLINKIKSNS